MGGFIIFIMCLLIFLIIRRKIQNLNIINYKKEKEIVININKKKYLFINDLKQKIRLKLQESYFIQCPIYLEKIKENNIIYTLSSLLSLLML